MIVRGTTPYQSFIVPMEADSINKVYVTYFQNNELILEKDQTTAVIEDITNHTDNAEIEEIDTIEEEEIEYLSQITLHLSQEDTLKFKFYPAAEKNIAVIQLRILDTKGEAYASDPVQERIFGVLKEGVI